MSQQGPLPYLKFCGVEVANAARTLSYLKRGLGNTMQGHWELSPGDVCSVLYRVDGSGGVPAVFLSPEDDPAPWYDPDEPGAKDFLGVVLLNIAGYDSTAQRTVTSRLSGLQGGVLSAQWRQPRTWKFDAALVSASDAGAEYGLRWLTSALEASECDDCSTCDLTVKLVCPPDDGSDDTLGEWMSYEVGLVDGPHETGTAASVTAEAMGGCRDFVLVNFTMVAGNPFLYEPLEDLLLDYTETQDNDCADYDICSWLFGDTTPTCVEVEPPSRGVVGTIATFHSAAGIGGMIVEAYAGGCDSSGGPIGAPTLSLELSGIPAESTVTVDSALHLITVTDDATGTVSDGRSLVELQPGRGIQWIEVRDCDDLTCVCVRTSAPCVTGTVDVTLATRSRQG